MWGQDPGFFGVLIRQRSNTEGEEWELWKWEHAIRAIGANRFGGSGPWLAVDSPGVEIVTARLGWINRTVVVNGDKGRGAERWFRADAFGSRH